jgi:hypothetical protein
MKYSRNKECIEIQIYLPLGCQNVKKSYELLCLDSQYENKGTGK